MADLNYITGIFKILESPILIKTKRDSYFTIFRAYLSQTSRNSNASVVILCIWGYLANDINKYYSKDDYILIEGYLSIQEREIKEYSFNKNLKNLVQINVRKIFPLYLNN